MPLVTVKDIVNGNLWNDLKYFYRDRNRNENSKIMRRIFWLDKFTKDISSRSMLIFTYTKIKKIIKLHINIVYSK